MSRRFARRVLRQLVHPSDTRLVGVMLVSAFFGVPACASGGTKTGNGVQLEFSTTPSPLSLEQNGGGGSHPDAGEDAGLSVDAATGGSGGEVAPSFRLETAKLFVSEVRLRAKGTVLCSGSISGGPGLDCPEGDIRLRRSLALDLLEPEASELAGYTFPVANYERVEIRFEDEGETPSGDRASFVFEGVIGDGSGGKRVVITSRRNDELRFENANGVSVLDGQWLSAQVNIERWVDVLPLQACIASGEVKLRDGRYVFDDDTKCADAPRLVFEELGASTRLDGKEK